jgi:hypothetical protein
MSSPFLSTGSGNIQAVLNSGTQSANLTTIIDQSLIPNLPVCSNADKQLISRQLGTADLNFTPLTNPFVGTLQASDFKSDDFASIDTAIGDLNTKAQNISIATVPGTTDFGTTAIQGVTTLTADLTAVGYVNTVSVAGPIPTPSANRVNVWSKTSDKRLYATDDTATENKIAYFSDIVMAGGDTITNGTGESVIVNVDGSITFDGGCAQSVFAATGTGVYTPTFNVYNIIVTNPLTTGVSLPASIKGTTFYIRREYPLQMGEVWPASVFTVTAVGIPIENLPGGIGITAYASIRLLNIDTKWIVC